MSDKHDDGGPAFACKTAIRGGQEGMSLRDWFAGQAMASLLHGTSIHRRPVASMLAEIGYEIADAMIAERKREQA